MPKNLEATEAMDMTPPKVDTAEEGAVGGETDVDPNTHPMAWMCDRQNSYSNEMISFWPLLHPTHEWRRNGYQASCALFAVYLAMVLHCTYCILPSHPK